MMVNELQSKIEMHEKISHTSSENFACNIYDFILKTECEMYEHKTDNIMETDKQAAPFLCQTN